MGEHTPTPWRPLPNRRIVDGRGHFVASVQLGISSSNTCEMAANAAFIVKACNAHANLIAALEFIRDGYANQDVNHVDYRVKVYQVALDALAKVSGMTGERT